MIRRHSPSCFGLLGILGRSALTALGQNHIHWQKAGNVMRRPSDQHETSDETTGEGKSRALAVARRDDVITQVQRRITDASNVRGLFEGLFLQARARYAVAAMADQAIHAAAVASCVDEHVKVLQAMDRFYEASLQLQMRRDLAADIYESHAEGEREQWVEAKHKRDLAELRREKDRFDGEREAISARHGVEAEKKFKAEKFALGKQRLAGRIAEAHVSFAVARTAAGEPSDWQPGVAANEPTEVSVLHGLIEKKQREIEEREADGRDTADQRVQLVKLKEALASVSSP
jgi:hypothetical protein